MIGLHKVGVTATRDGLTDKQDEALGEWFAEHPAGELHHGDCVGGDNAAYIWAKSFSWRTVAHPAKVHPSLRAYTLSDVILPAKPPLDRNHDIVDETAELLACPKGPEELRSGTWATIRYARKLRRPLAIVWPNGEVTQENHIEAGA